MARSNIPFTRVYDGILAGLSDAGASATQILAYEYLTRWHGDRDGEPFVCWASAKDAAGVLLTDVSTVSRALRGLCKKTFSTADGRRVPVLERLSGGHNGACATYRDNLYAYAVGGQSCLPTGGEVGGQSCLPTGGEVGSSNDTPTRNVENRVGRQIGPSRWANRSELVGNSAYPIEIEEEKSPLSSSLLRTLPMGGALRPAQSAARRRESTPQAETRDVDSLVSGVAGAARADAGEPGPLEAETLREALAAFNAGRDLTPEQEAIHRKFAQSRAWEDIRAGR